MNGKNYSHVLFHDFRNDEDYDDLLVDDLVLPTINTSDFDLVSFADEGDLYLRRR